MLSLSRWLRLTLHFGHNSCLVLPLCKCCIHTTCRRQLGELVNRPSFESGIGVEGRGDQRGRLCA